MPEPAFDEELLEIAIERRPVLETLLEGPHHRRELQEQLDLSKTTCHRIIRTFDERGLLERTDNGYALSIKGEMLAEQTQQYHDNVRAVSLMEPVVASFRETPFEFPIEHFADGRITVPEPDNPTVPISTEFEIFQQYDTHLQIDYNQWIPPLYMEQLADIVLEREMQFEHILTADMVQDRLDRFADLHKQQVEGEINAEISYRVCDSIPFGMTIYDREHVAVRAYDDDTGTIALLVDTDDPEAVAWAEEVHAHYHEVATPAAEVSVLPDWTPCPDVDI